VGFVQLHGVLVLYFGGFGMDIVQLIRMKKMKLDTLETIYQALAEVADLQFAIDAGVGDEMAHWQEIGVIDHRLRRLVNTLPDEVFIQAPSLALFALSSQPIQSCWSSCRDEVGAVLAHVWQSV
jgi:hypothetical protein